MRLPIAGVYPITPAKGSVGTLGELAPLACMSALLLGMGEAHVGRERLPTLDALIAAVLSPITLAPKEGLALLNGTQVSTALAIHGLFQIEPHCQARSLHERNSTMLKPASASTPDVKSLHLSAPACRLTQPCRRIAIGRGVYVHACPSVYWGQVRIKFRN